MLGMRIAGARRPIDRLKPHQAQQTTGPATTDAHALAALMTDHLTGAVERILQAQLIDAPHQRPGSPGSRPWACQRARSVRSPRSASSAIFAFKSPENLRPLLIAYPSSVGGIHLKHQSDFPRPPQSQVRAAANDFCIQNRRCPPLRCNALLSAACYDTSRFLLQPPLGNR